MVTKSRLNQRCPNNHTLPHITKQGRCTPVRCAEIPGAKKSKVVKTAEVKKKIQQSHATMTLRRNKVLETATKKLVKQASAQPIPLPDGASAPLASEGRIEQFSAGSLAAGKHFARMAFINDMPAADADEVIINNWTDKRIIKNLPLAVAEKEYQLKFGDDDQRERAADKFIAMAGRSTKEGHLSGGAAIILHMEGGSIQLPYAPKQIEAPKDTVDGEVVRAKKQA